MIEQIPSKVSYKSKFNVKFRLINCCGRTIEPQLNFDNFELNQSLLWLGLSGRSLGQLEPSNFVDFELSLYPIKTGMHSLPRIKISDSTLKNDYHFDEIAFVFVEESLTN
jgi:hypothetical protein